MLYLLLAALAPLTASGALQTLLPTRIDYASRLLQPLAISARYRTSWRKRETLRGLLVLDMDGTCELLFEESEPVAGRWTMLPAAHEILDRVYDEIRLVARVDGERFEASARLYARWPLRPRRALTSHGTVLRGDARARGRPVVASFSLSALDPHLSADPP